MENNLLLGIDAGTTKIKTIIYDQNGNIVAKNEDENKLIDYGNGKIEQDMDLLWKKVAKCINQLLTNNKIDASDIKGIGLSGQGEGCWLVDKSGNPSANAILWSDSRAQIISENIAADPKLLSLYRKNTGSFPFAGAQIIILKWLAENQPELLEKSRHLFFSKDWLRFKLTGDAAIEYTDASTSIINLSEKKISSKLFEKLQINEYLDLLPQLKKSDEIAGYISEEAAAETGLKEGTAVITGLMDIVATALGTGAVSKNDCCTILGTTCCNEIVTGNFDPEEKSVAGYEIHALNKNYLNVMATMSGTPNLDWFLDQFMEDIIKKSKKEKFDLFSYLEEKMKKIEAGSGGIIYHPYISPSGERAPFSDKNACSQFFGLSTKANRFHLLRAVYEGVAYSIRDCLDNSPQVKKIYLTGGGAKSKFWAQIISDVSGKIVYRVEDSDPASRGAALLAGLAVGVYSDINSVIEKVNNINKKIVPNLEKHKLYSSLYKIYLKSRKLNKELWEERAKVMEKGDIL